MSSILFCSPKPGFAWGGDKSLRKKGLQEVFFQEILQAEHGDQQRPQQQCQAPATAAADDVMGGG